MINNLDQEQAQMFRWVRSRMNEHMFQRLTGSQFDNRTELEKDLELKISFEKYIATYESERIIGDAKIRTGLLPESLGLALQEYTEAIVKSTLSSVTNDLRFNAEEALKASTETIVALKNLCNEMANLR